MNYRIDNRRLLINKDGHRAEIPLTNLDQLLIDPVLEYLDFSDLMEIWKNLYGIPANLKNYLEQKIKLYDTSIEVNSFLIGENKFWLDKATRVGLMHLANCSTDNIQLVLGEQILTISVDTAKNFLQQLEVYAGQCYLQTQKHLIAIKDLKTIEDIINYDYTKGYPEKIKFEL